MSNTPYISDNPFSSRRSRTSRTSSVPLISYTSTSAPSYLSSFFPDSRPNITQSSRASAIISSQSQSPTPATGSFGFFGWIFTFIILIGASVFLIKNMDEIKTFVSNIFHKPTPTTDTTEPTTEQVPDATDSKSTLSPATTTDTNPATTENDELSKALKGTKAETPVLANDNLLPKKGFCYVGSDRGHRTCEYVGLSDKCMSGNIFPTKEICINPTLRM